MPENTAPTAQQLAEQKAREALEPQDNPEHIAQAARDYAAKNYTTQED